MAKLLMLDDDVEATSWMRAALESRGHDVTVYYSARDALESLQTFRPELIVADILMPEIDGVAFARFVRVHRGVPVMFVSIAKKQAEAVLAGAVGYVSKLATAQQIREAVERVLVDRDRRNVVLVVDDEQDVLDLYRDYLRGPFEVLDAGNGVEALRTLKKQRVDLAIIDVHMPVMNGMELVRAIRADPALDALPIIVQTCDQAALKASVWKPLRVAQVLDKVRFVDWFEEQMRDLPPTAPGSAESLPR
jgi:CheY-like chemotaxis protein